MHVRSKGVLLVFIMCLLLGNSVVYANNGYQPVLLMSGSSSDAGGVLSGIAKAIGDLFTKPITSLRENMNNGSAPMRSESPLADTIKKAGSVISNLFQPVSMNAKDILSGRRENMVLKKQNEELQTKIDGLQKENQNIIMYVMIAAGVLLLIAIIAFFLSKRKKKPKKVSPVTDVVSSNDISPSAAQF